MVIFLLTGRMDLDVPTEIMSSISERRARTINIRSEHQKYRVLFLRMEQKNGTTHGISDRARGLSTSRSQEKKSDEDLLPSSETTYLLIRIYVLQRLRCQDRTNNILFVSQRGNGTIPGQTLFWGSVRIWRCAISPLFRCGKEH